MRPTVEAARKSERKTGIETDQEKRACCGQGKGVWGGKRSERTRRTKERKTSVGRRGMGSE